MTDSLMDIVAEAMHEAASEAILPRYQALALGDTREKSPGEIVTIADHEAERMLTARLAGLLPGSRVVGEEAAEDNPSILAGLDQGDIWLVDPLDGTRNFVEGHPYFAVMIALVRSGETVAAWMLDPVRNRLARAEQGSGAYLDERRMISPRTSPGPERVHGLVMTGFLPPRIREHIIGRLKTLPEVTPELRCAGHQYPMLAEGRHQFALYWRTLPWDHAPGVLFLTEAGGHAGRLDGSPYHPADSRLGLLVAQNQSLWQDARQALFGPAFPDLRPGN